MLLSFLIGIILHVLLGFSVLICPIVQAQILFESCSEIIFVFKTQYTAVILQRKCILNDNIVKGQYISN